MSKAKFINAARTVIANYHQGYIDAYPDHPYSYERQGYILFRQHQYAKAISRLEEAAQLGTDHGKLWRTIGLGYHEEFKVNQDAQLLEKAVAAFGVRHAFCQAIMLCREQCYSLK